MSGGMFIDSSKEPRGWSDLAKAADKALAATSETPFLIRVRMLAGEQQALPILPLCMKKPLLAVALVVTFVSLAYAQPLAEL